MKRILIAALALIVASASFTTAEAAKKKKKKEQEKPAAEVLAPVNLVSGSDSLSYVAGMTFTEGLLPYLINQMKVDTAYMADFVSGFREALSLNDDPKAVARMAGMQIAVRAAMCGSTAIRWASRTMA